jgi:hypothetical protein
MFYSPLNTSAVELRRSPSEMEAVFSSLPTKEEERVGERSLVLLILPSPHSFLAGRGSVSYPSP